MFKPIALLLFILGIGALIAAAQPGEERGDPAKAISADGGTSSAAGGLIAGLEAGGTALATAADAVAGQVEAEAMDLVLAQEPPTSGRGSGAPATMPSPAAPSPSPPISAASCASTIRRRCSSRSAGGSA